MTNKSTLLFVIYRAEEEAKDLRKETLLLGELLRKMRENASLSPKIVYAERENHLSNTYKFQVVLTKGVFFGNFCG